MRSATVVFAIALLGCANKDGAPTKGSAARGSATVDARPRPIVMPPTANQATTQDVVATSIVVMKQDGTVSVLPLFEAVVSIGIELATLQPGPAVTIAELAAKVEEAQRQVRADREAVDDAGGVGTKMQDPDGKMGKKPDQAGTNPCGDFASITTGFDDADIYGGLLGAEVQGGYGFAPGPGGGDGWGRIGVGAQARPYAAGLIGRSLKTTAFCGASTPLILADARAPAAKLVEVMSALPEAQLAVTTDGGAHARALAIRFTFQAGNTPFGDDLEIGFTVSPDGARGSAYRGATADAAVWSWSGAGAIGDAYHQGQATDALLGNTVVRLRIEGDLAAGAMVEAIAALLAANVDGVAIGEPTAYLPPPSRSASDDRVGRVTLGQPTLSGDLDKTIIRRYVKRQLAKLTYCYEKQLVAKPDLQGTVDASWVIEANGSVTSSHATGVDEAVSSCVAAVISTIHFPKPKGGGVVNVSSYPFRYEPAGG